MDDGVPIGRNRCDCTFPPDISSKQAVTMLRFVKNVRVGRRLRRAGGLRAMTACGRDQGSPAGGERATEGGEGAMGAAPHRELGQSASVHIPRTLWPVARLGNGFPPSSGRSGPRTPWTSEERPTAQGVYHIQMFQAWSVNVWFRFS